MEESNQPTDPDKNPPVESTAPAEKTPPAPKPRKKRRWPKVIAALLLILVLLVVFVPTIISTAPVRSMVVSTINKNINGTLSVNDWSMGWFSPIKINGVVLDDAQGVRLVEIPKIETELTLANAVRGRLHLGKVVIERLNVLAKIDENGRTNFEQLARSADSQPQTKREKPQQDGPIQLPDLSGDIQLVDCRATVEDKRQGQTFYFPSISGHFKIPDINQTIENTLTVQCRVGDQPPGEVKLEGTVDLTENNVLDLQNLSADQTATVKNFEVGAVSFALGKDSGIQTLAGLTNATVKVNSKPGAALVASADLNIQNLTAGGPALGADTYRSKSFALSAPSITIDRSASADDVLKWLIKAGTQDQPVKLSADQGTVMVYANLPLSAAMNVAENAAPGAAGVVRSHVDVDLAALSRTLPNLMSLQEGTTLESGRAQLAASLVMTPQKADIRIDPSVKDIRARDKAGKQIALDPITLSLAATSLGGGKDIPDLRDLKLDIQSVFISGTIAGQNLSQTSGQLNADLRRAREELAKVFDLGPLQMDGRAKLTIASEGNLVETQKGTVKVGLDISALQLSGFGEPSAATSLAVSTLRGGVDCQINEGAASSANGSFNAEGFTYASAGRRPLANERVEITFAAQPAADLSSVHISKLSATMRMLTADVQKADLVLKVGERDATTAQMLRALTATVTANDFAALQALLDGFAEPAKPGEKPPMKLAGGSGTVTIEISPKGAQQIVKTNISAPKIVLASGKVSDTLENVSLVTQLSFSPTESAAESAGILEQIRDLNISQLVAKVQSDGAPVANVTLIEPITIARPGELLTSPSINAAINATGDMAQLFDVVKVAQGNESPDGDYKGTYSFDQRITSNAGGILAKGTGTIADLSVQNGANTITEKLLRFENDATFDSAKDLLAIRSVSLGMEQSKAFGLNASGTIRELSAAMRLDNVKGTLSYDWEKAWAFVEPMLTPEQKKLGMKPKGTGEREFVLNGPLSDPQGLNALNGHAGVGFESFEIMGETIRNLDIPITIHQGVLTIAHASRQGADALPKPAPVGEGSINLGGIQLTLGERLLVNVPEGHVLLDRVPLNAIFSDQLGNWINNPVFVKPSEASGEVTVKIAECKNFDPSSLQTPQPGQPPVQNAGRAKVLLSIGKMQLGNPLMLELARVLHKEELARSLQGEIKEAAITIADGKVHQDIQILRGTKKRPFHITGTTDLLTDGLNLTFIVPADQLGGDFERYAPNGLPIPITGTTRNYKFDPGAAVQKLIKDNALEALLGKTLDEALKGKPRKDAAPSEEKSEPETTTTEPEKPVDPLGDLLRREKERKEKEDAEKAARRARERERKAREQQQKAEEPEKPAEEPKERRRRRD